VSRSSYCESVSASTKINIVRNATAGANMRASRRTALTAGLWFAATFVFSIPALFFYDPVLNDADYILGAGADTRTEFGAFGESRVVPPHGPGDPLGGLADDLPHRQGIPAVSNPSGRSPLRPANVLIDGQLLPPLSFMARQARATAAV
jgi:hypothetical protein